MASTGHMCEFCVERIGGSSLQYVRSKCQKKVKVMIITIVVKIGILLSAQFSARTIMRSSATILNIYRGRDTELEVEERR